MDRRREWQPPPEIFPPDLPADPGSCFQLESSKHPFGINRAGSILGSISSTARENKIIYLGICNVPVKGGKPALLATLFSILAHHQEKLHPLLCPRLMLKTEEQGLDTDPWGPTTSLSFGKGLCYSGGVARGVEHAVLEGASLRHARGFSPLKSFQAGDAKRSRLGPLHATVSLPPHPLATPLCYSGIAMALPPKVPPVSVSGSISR